MSTPNYVYLDEKVPEVYVLPAPASAPTTKRSSCFARLSKFILAALGAFLVLNVVSHAIPMPKMGCHGMRKHGEHLFDNGGQRPLLPPKNWHQFEGTTHFEFDPAHASGFSVTGTDAFGSVVFETSKLAKQIVVDLDVKTNHHDKDGQVSITEKDGYVTIDTPSTGDLKTFASAKILIPSNIIGHFAIPDFEIDVPKHMVDFSGLPESLEIGSLVVRVGKGFVKPGPVHTNHTQITIANGALKGALVHARHETNVDVAKGNVTLKISDISSGNQGATKIHLGDGYFKGDLAIYNETTIDVASGGIYLDVDFKESDPRAKLSTKTGSGNSRVYVHSIAAERLLESSHVSVNGDQLITYPSNFQGTIDARGLLGNVKLEGEELAVEKVLGGLVGKKGDSERNSISVKTVKGKLDILVGDE